MGTFVWMVDVSDKDGRWTGTTQQAASLIVLLYILFARLLYIYRLY